MELKPITDRKQIEELSTHTQPIQTFILNRPFLERFKDNKMWEYTNLLFWYSHHNLRPSNFNNYKKLAEMFNTKPIFKMYSNKTAVWAFEFKGKSFIFYHSTRGSSVEVDFKFPPTKEAYKYSVEVIKCLEKLLCVKGQVTSYRDIQDLWKRMEKQ